MENCPAETYAKRIWDDKDLSAIDAFFDKEAIIHSSLGKFIGSEMLKEVIKTWFSAFPDLRVKNLHTIRKEDCVTIYWKAEGHQTGEFQGIKPTGKKVAYSGSTLYRLKGNKIIEYRANLDLKHIVSQL